MKKFLRFLALFLGAAILSLILAFVWPWSPHFEVADSESEFAFNHVNIVDTLHGGVIPDQAVVIQRGEITNIVPASEFVPAPGFTVIDASHQFLMPGLWDMHTHSLKISPKLHHPLFIRYGVTSVRDMSGCLNTDDAFWACPEDRRRWQDEAIAGQRIAPRYPLQSSYQSNGGNEVPESYPDFFRLGNLTAANELVDFYLTQQVDFIKTYTELSPQQFQDLSSAAMAKGMDLAGHRPIAISLQDALAANMRSIEHGRLFMFECFEGAAAFRNSDDPIGSYNAEFIRQLIEGQDEEACAGLMSEMASSKTAWVPTLTTIKMSAMARDDSFRSDPRQAYIPWIVRKLIWEQDANRAATRGIDAAGQFVHGDFLATALKQVKAAHSAGVQILAGTDNIDTYVFTGSSLHDELAMFVQAGLSPLEAIQAATIEPARFAGLQHDFGSVTVGKKADLLLLNTNPTENVKNTSDIAAVVFAGRYLSENDLEQLDHLARDSAGSLKTNLEYLYNMLTSPLMRMQLVD